MEGLGKPVNQLVTPSIFGFNKALPERKYDVAAAKKLLADAGFANGFKVQFSFTKDRLPGDTQVGTSIAQMLAAIGIDAAANAQPANVFFPARTRGEFSMSMSGWGTLTGEAHYTLSSLAHSNDKEKKMGAFNVLNYKNAEMDKLLQDAAVEMDECQAQPLSREGERAGAEGSPAAADRCGRLGLGDAEGQGEDHRARGRGYPRHEHQAGEIAQAGRGGGQSRPAPPQPSVRIKHVTHRNRHPRRLRHARAVADDRGRVDRGAASTSPTRFERDGPS